MATVNINDMIDANDIFEIQSLLLDKLNELEKEPDKVYEQADRETVYTQPDETPAPSTTEAEDLKAAQEEIRRLKRQLEGYKKRKKATTEDVENLRNPKKMETAKQKAASTKEVAWADQDFPSKPGVASVNGKKINYKLLRKPVNWGSELSESTEDIEANIELIRRKITEDARSNFGGWSRVTELDVVGGQLIINGVMYVPCIESKYLKRLPLDAADYLSGGCVAQLFDFASLREMSRLTTFVCDSMDFYLANISADLGLGRRIGVSSLFKVCKNLYTLTLGNETITRDGLNGESSYDIKNKLRTRKRWSATTDGLTMCIYGGTGGLQNYMFTNLKNYATNRGNKGLIRFCGGTLARTGLLVGAGTLNLGTHVLGGVISGVASMFSAASQRADDES